MNWRRNVEENTRDTFSYKGWKSEIEVVKRQRKSVWFMISALVAMAAFWTSPWAWIAFFSIMAIYSVAVNVRIGFLCGASFALWFLVGIEGWVLPNTTLSQAIGLWCIGTLFLVVVWKGDQVAQAKKLLEANNERVS